MIMRVYYMNKRDIFSKTFNPPPPPFKSLWIRAWIMDKLPFFCSQPSTASQSVLQFWQLCRHAIPNHPLGQGSEQFLPYQPGGHAGNRMKIVDLLHVFNLYDAGISYFFYISSNIYVSAIEDSSVVGGNLSRVNNWIFSTSFKMITEQ